MNAVIRIRMSEAGRKADIIAGGDGAEVKSITVEPSDPLFAAVVQAGMVGDGSVVLFRNGCNDTNWDHTPTAAEVLADDARIVAEQAERERAEQAERTTATLAVLAERKTQPHRYCLPEEVRYETLSPDWPYYRDAGVVASPEAAAWEAELAAANEAAKVAAEELSAERVAAREAEEAAKKAAKEAARSEQRKRLGLEDDDRIFCIENGALMAVPVWESHSRGKNWLAVIAVNPRASGGFDREFADKAKGEAYYLAPDWQPGTPVEFGADYYSGGGSKQANRWYGFFVRVVTDGDAEYVVLRKCGTGKAACREGAEFIKTLVS